MTDAKVVQVRVHEILGTEPIDHAISLHGLSDEHDQLLSKIRRHPRRAAMAQDLTCAHLRPEPIMLVVAYLGPRHWSLRHWPRSGLHGGHEVKTRRSGMGDEHKRQEDYTQRCANDHPGGSGVLERSVARGTISDVVMRVNGATIATSEIQLADEHVANIRRRDTAVVNNGIDPLWFGHTDARPGWAPEVAWLGTNRVEHMRPGGWTVASGRRAVEWERCSPSMPLCDGVTRSGWCGKRHPVWRPRGGTVDDLIGQVLDRQLRRYDVGQQVIVAAPADVEAWADFYGTDPVDAAARAAAAARKRELAQGKHVTHRPYRPDRPVPPVETAASTGEQRPIAEPAAELTLFPLGTVEPTTCSQRGCHAIRERGYSLCRWHRLDAQHHA